MTETKRIGQCIVAKVLAQGKFDSGDQITDSKKREIVYFATSIDAALQFARFENYRYLTAVEVDPNSVKNEPRYDLGEAWAKKHRPTGNFLRDVYSIGGRTID